MRSKALNFKLDGTNRVTIRAANIEDAGHIAGLCDQLGYPTSQEQVESRLKLIEQGEDQAVYVAERSSDGYVVGWVHMCVRQLVMADRHTEIGGLVVDEAFRRYGVGRLLMEWAEGWARAKGCGMVYLRSNIIRKEAHAFYEAMGYSTIKTSRVFRKFL